MPFVYDFTGEEWDEHDDEMSPPSVDRFQYLPPPEFSGAQEPALYEEDTTASTDSGVNERSLWSRFSTIFSKRSETSPASRKLFGAVCPGLRQLGGVRVRCAYDGGNDEGFAWITALETDSAALSLSEIVDQLDAAGLTKQILASCSIVPNMHRTERQAIEDVLNYELADSWAVQLLGFGYGTGEYTMYGAFTVDLVNRTIHDDRNAQPPENGNIEIRR